MYFTKDFLNNQSQRKPKFGKINESDGEEEDYMPGNEDLTSQLLQ